MDPSAGWIHGTATQWLPVICQGTGGIGVEETMPLVSYAVARRAGAICTRHRTPQLTVPLPKYNGPNHSTHTGTLRTRLTWRIVIALLLTTAHHAGAQRVTGPWDDAAIAPRGILRIGISPRFGQWRERLTSPVSGTSISAQLHPRPGKWSQRFLPTPW